ncbi:hypothetical protein [Natronorubrum aibiense]|uniref:DUF2238 domain-containing protein n=1 Tax=Natronorubrum aibiense TaxID=348826 RepID=A0A5P9P855_9EURY|nr:hypothetical protein [Natronorubrum aibiense]QFU84313.1 hypothetical protein GCU68_17225 [Natronorubrum aibiense]
MTTDSDVNTVLGLSERRCWHAVRLIQGLLLIIVGYALVTVNLGLVVNAAIPLALTFLPALVRREFTHEMGAGLALWIALAAFLHAAGALGPYEMFGWYDSVTHTVSATLVAGVGYAIVDALDQSAESVTVPGEFRFVFILIFVLAFGVLWEIMEFASAGVASVVGGEPVLAQYGTSDIVFDLLYNAVGALLVALWGTGYFDGVAGLVSRRFSRTSDSS